MTIMNEIVGESGERGEGCLTMALILTGSGVLAIGLMAVWAWMW